MGISPRAATYFWLASHIGPDNLSKATEGAITEGYSSDLYGPQLCYVDIPNVVFKEISSKEGSPRSIALTVRVFQSVQAIDHPNDIIVKITDSKVKEIYSL